MAQVNATRNRLEQNVTYATEDARLIGFDDAGKACVWSGGYTFRVYDAARDWTNTRTFTSGEMAAGVSDCSTEHAIEMAKERMDSEGFTAVRP